MTEMLRVKKSRPIKRRLHPFHIRSRILRESLPQHLEGSNLVILTQDVNKNTLIASILILQNIYNCRHKHRFNLNIRSTSAPVITAHENRQLMKKWQLSISQPLYYFETFYALHHWEALILTSPSLSRAPSIPPRTADITVYQICVSKK